MASNKRPLSPHLQVYKPSLTMMMSITHRATGVVLVVGALILAWWLLAMAGGPGPYATAQGFLGSAIGKLGLFVWTAVLFYHLCNGIRHLFWDSGYGYSKETALKSGRIVLVAATVLTLIVWIAALTSGGAA